jgi:CRP-like cAMP-binding protein
VKQIHDLLAEHPLLADLPPADLDLVAGCGRLARFGPDDLLVRTGGAADTFHLLRSGRVALEMAVAGPPLVIETLGPGDVVGASWLLPPYRWQFDARALGEVGTVEVDAACPRGKCEADHRLGYELMSRFVAVFAERLQATRLRLLDVYGQREAR